MLAQSLGSMVHNQGMHTWLAVRDEELWKLEEKFFPKSTVFSSFMAIYYSMHHTLKLCFLYLSVFPRGSIIDKDELIRQWRALDLFRSERGTFSASLLGEIYTGDLLSASILEVVDTSLVSCRLQFFHDEYQLIALDITFMPDNTIFTSSISYRSFLSYN
jgi:hypothetical protein